MKQLKFFLSLSLFLLLQMAQAAYFKNSPFVITQPNGTSFDVYVSGDEYFNYIHDENNYTLIQAADGYYCYAEKNETGEIIASAYRYGTPLPSDAKIQPFTKISKQKYLERRNVQLKSASDIKTFDADTLNNLVIYIQFSDDDDFEKDRAYYDAKFNNEEDLSLFHYYKEVSYGKMNIISSQFPESVSGKNTAYIALQSRRYYQPYNETTNINGYKDGQAANREHTLIVSAMNAQKKAIEAAFTPEDLDKNNDGYVDNVTFIIKGENDGWSDLLWAHRWYLYTQDYYIHGKQVYDYIFQPESQFNVKTLCHEMFHALGAPDLYHYNDGGLDLSPLGGWDLMESGFGHMTAFMKYRYTSWLDSIPVISEEGEYTLNPLSDSTNNCYRINSPYSNDEYFVLEYRKKSTSQYEANLPGSGLMVYRIDNTLSGRGNASGPPDELYAFRPGGTVNFNGNVNDAFFSSVVGRNEFHVGTNPKPFLQDGTDGGIGITEISEPGDQISFRIGLVNVANPTLLKANAVSDTQIDLNWKLNLKNNYILVAYNETVDFGNPDPSISYREGDEIEGGGTVITFTGFKTQFEHTDLNPNQTYYYKAWSYDGKEFSTGTVTNASTHCAINVSEHFGETFETGETLKDLCWRTFHNFDFDGGLAPEYLKEVDFDLGDITWNIVGKDDLADDESGYILEGDYSVLITSRTTGFNWLVSPYIEITGSSDHQLTFDIWYENSPDSLDVMQYSNFYVMIENNGRWENVYTLDAVGDNNTASNKNETQVNIDLEPYRYRQIRIAFVQEATSGWPIALDNIWLENRVDKTEFGNQVSGFEVFPNPVGKQQLLHIDTHENGTLEITDINGATIQRNAIEAGKHDLSLERLQPGIIFVIFSTENTVYQRKILIK